MCSHTLCSRFLSQKLMKPLTQTSLGFLDKKSTLRRGCLWLCRCRYFENFILLAIVANCGTLAAGSSREDFDDTALGIGLAQAEFFFLAVFALEMVLKVIALGFVTAPRTYLRDGWNVLDFLVVVLGFVQLGNFGNYTSIRTVRVLRPLRTVTRVPGMKAIVVSLLGSLPQLLDVLGLCGFMFFVWGIVGIQLFAGLYNNRCGAPDFSDAVLDSSSYVWSGIEYVVPADKQDTMCSGPMSEKVTWQDMYQNGSRVAFGNESPVTGRACPDGFFCTAYGNPNMGMTSFDNILWSWLLILQTLTMSTWAVLMYGLMDAVNPAVFIYFVATIIMFTYFIVQLTVAVLYMNYSVNSRRAGMEEESDVSSEGFYDEIGREEDEEAARKLADAGSPADAADPPKKGGSHAPSQQPGVDGADTGAGPKAEACLYGDEGGGDDCLAGPAAESPPHQATLPASRLSRMEASLTHQLQSSCTTSSADAAGGGGLVAADASDYGAPSGKQLPEGRSPCAFGPGDDRPGEASDGGNQPAGMNSSCSGPAPRHIALSRRQQRQQDVRMWQCSSSTAGSHAAAGPVPGPSSLAVQRCGDEWPPGPCSEAQGLPSSTLNHHHDHDLHEDHVDMDYARSSFGSSRNSSFDHLIEPPHDQRAAYAVYLLRWWCLRLALSPAYEKFSMTVIIINTIDMCIYYYPMDPQVDFANSIINYICTVSN